MPENLACIHCDAPPYMVLDLGRKRNKYYYCEQHWNEYGLKMYDFVRRVRTKADKISFEFAPTPQGGGRAPTLEETGGKIYRG